MLQQPWLPRFYSLKLLLFTSLSVFLLSLYLARVFLQPTSPAIPIDTMNSLRSISKLIVNREQAEGVGARVFRSIGSLGKERLDPFLLLDHFKVQPPAGFPDHPHRGFETVTYMLKGSIEHEDFAKHRGRIGPGDLQWMTAGRGIVHAEMPAGTDVSEGLQLWVNLPVKDKMCKPTYQELLDGSVPRAHPEEGGAVVKVIAGEQFGVKSEVRTRTPILYLDVELEKGRQLEHTIPASYNGLIYIIQGRGRFGKDDKEGEDHTTLVLDSEGDKLPVTADEDTELHYVLIAGEPINEPVVQYGPFVMNSREGIEQAFNDYQNAENGFEDSRGWKSEIGNRGRER